MTLNIVKKLNSRVSLNFKMKFEKEPCPLVAIPPTPTLLGGTEMHNNWL